ncbi:hypothetical protein MMC26_001276 [Xylographa opegraphella]|nr:hypothetical protein [Xylographa opegraphella]
MKILTTNFLTCAVKACKSSAASYPLHFQDAELEQADMEYNPAFLRNILPRIEWDALRVTATEVSKPPARRVPPDRFTSLPAEKPDMSGLGVSRGAAEQEEGRMDTGEESAAGEEEGGEKMLRELHRLLLETQDQRGDCQFLAAESPGLRGEGWKRLRGTVEERKAISYEYQGAQEETGRGRSGGKEGEDSLGEWGEVRI